MCSYRGLSNSELLSMIVSNRASEGLVKEFSNLYSIVDVEESELLQIEGIGIKRAQQIKAIIELARRIYEVDWNRNKIKIAAPGDVANILMNEMKFLCKEHFKVVLLNTKNQIIDIETVSIGTINASIVHPRETFSTAIKRSANAIIVVHNHPSGDSTPSNEDISITNRLVDAGNLIGIKVLDHIIIGMNRYTSFKEENLI